MTDIVVNDIDPRIQYTAAGGQTLFTFPFAVYASTVNGDLKVYQTPNGQVANDQTQLLVVNVNYTITVNAAPAVGGSITLTVGATAGDIITIVRDMQQTRLNNYLDGGQWSATQFNTDFDRTVLYSQTDKMYARDITPHYNSSAIIANGGYDFNVVLPLLSPLTSWRMNAAGTAIEAFAPQGGGGGGIGAILPTTAFTLARFADAQGTVANSMVSQNAAGTILTVNGDEIVNNIQVNNLAGKNLLINGDMQVWQRYAGGTATTGTLTNATQYGPDRWQVRTGAATSGTFSQQVVLANSQYFCCRAQRNNGNAGTANILIGQSLTRAMSSNLAGNVVTLSFRARAGANFSAAGSNLNVQIVTGTGNNDVSNLTTGFAGAVTANNSNVVLTANFQTFSVTPAALGAGVTQIYVQFQFTPVGNAGANDYFDITDVQLEISPYKSQFQRLNFYDSFKQCLPFYQKSFLYTTAPAPIAGIGTQEALFRSGVAAPGTTTSLQIYYEGSIRVTNPTIVTYNPNANNIQVVNEASLLDAANTVIFFSGDQYFVVQYDVPGGTVANDKCGVHWTSSSELT